MTKQGFTYSDAGVNIDAANAAKSRIRLLARETFTPQVISDIGSFGGMFRADFSGMAEPILVCSADGVGTKLQIAFMTGIHNTVGYDLVCHCVNDILVQGARPLLFLDYVATGRMNPDVVAGIVEGIANGCRESGCALIGGETAEMPGFYRDGEYDVAGFIVGVADRSKVIDGSGIRPGDVLIGLPSAGLHTNGYSLARKLFFEVAGYRADTVVEELGCSVAKELLKPHRSYLKVLERLIESRAIKGLAHITGGGLLENLPRILPEGTAVEIESNSWPVLSVFKLMAKLGNVPDSEMYRTFNMGIGMMVVTGPERSEEVRQHFVELGEPHYHVGRIVEGNREVVIC